MPGLPRKSTKKQFAKLMKKKGKKDISNVKARNIATYEEFIVNEGKHGKIEVWGKNEGEEAMIVGYAGTEEIAKSIEDDFREDFDEVWHKE